MGRPPHYENSEELQSKIDEYFEKGVATRKVIIGPATNRTESEIKVPTITGLVLYCGFCDRSSFYKYEEKEEFRHTIKEARGRIAQHYEELLQSGLGAGAIFALKNFGWRDKTELEHLGGFNVTVMPTVKIGGKEQNLGGLGADPGT